MIKEGKIGGRAVLIAGPPGTGKTAIAMGMNHLKDDMAGKFGRLVLRVDGFVVRVGVLTGRYLQVVGGGCPIYDDFRLRDIFV